MTVNAANAKCPECRQPTDRFCGGPLLCQECQWQADNIDPDDYESDPDAPCTECHGDGWGILGDDFANTDPLWDGPDGQVIRCPNCHGSGKAKDMTYW